MAVSRLEKENRTWSNKSSGSEFSGPPIPATTIFCIFQRVFKGSMNPAWTVLQVTNKKNSKKILVQEQLSGFYDTEKEEGNFSFFFFSQLCHRSLTPEAAILWGNGSWADT